MKVENVIKIVADEHGITTKAIKSNSRERRFIRARQMACYVLSQDLNMDSKMIAPLLNLNDSTVRHHKTLIADWLKTYQDTQEHYENIKSKIDETKTHA